MKVKPVDPAAVIRDPHTKRPLPAEGGEVPENNFWVRRWLGIPGSVDGEVWKLEGKEWVRRKANGELVREPYVEPAASPTGREPVTPLTTREVK